MKKAPTEGIYIGIAGNVKRTWEIIQGQPMGELLAAFGLFLHKHYGRGETTTVLMEKIDTEFRKHGHSGCSALVEIQMLMDLMGARCLDDTTRSYLQNLEELEL